MDKEPKIEIRNPKEIRRTNDRNPENSPVAVKWDFRRVITTVRSGYRRMKSGRRTAAVQNLAAIWKLKGALVDG